MNTITLWGLTASPYQLKMQALLSHNGLPWRRYPEQTTPSRAIATYLRLQRARKRGSVTRYPAMVEGMDEYPAVPYYSFDGRQFHYDSSGLAYHLDALEFSQHKLLPEDPLQAFICRLIDEAFDEFGLYMVHHNRWITSADTNNMGEFTARELRKLMPFQKLTAKRLSERQTRRCPYLFSVPAEGFDPNFPETHGLLDAAWRNYLAAMEQVLTSQPYLLGQRFTLADASAYGQMGMNLVDGRAAELMEELAPRTYSWLKHIDTGEHRGSDGPLALSGDLAPLLQCICDTFVPLMRQNEEAYNIQRAAGQHLYNEVAFNQREALYDGEIMGEPFRSVVKTFQVTTWRELEKEWRQLGPEQRQSLRDQYPLLAL